MSFIATSWFKQPSFVRSVTHTFIATWRVLTHYDKFNQQIAEKISDEKQREKKWRRRRQWKFQNHRWFRVVLNALAPHYHSMAVCLCAHAYRCTHSNTRAYKQVLVERVRSIRRVWASAFNVNKSAFLSTRCAVRKQMRLVDSIIVNTNANTRGRKKGSLC